MPIAIICVLFASILPIIWIGYAKRAIKFDLKDNLSPRKALEKATGKALRAKWAHDNSQEAFAPFAVAVIIALITQVPIDKINCAALIFILARILYGLFYLADLGVARTIAWVVGIGCNFALYYFAWSYYTQLS